MVSTEGRLHETMVYMVQPTPTEIYAGAGMWLEVGVSCAESCDLRGSMLRIAAEDGAILTEVELAESDGRASLTGRLEVKAPSQPGEYTWTAVFPAQEREGIPHGQGSTELSFVVKPHSTSIAVWDVPSPVAILDKFKVKVGVKCSAACNLAGTEIEIYDHEGTREATAALGDAPWMTPGALYWAEVELQAPEEEGYHRRRVEFQRPNLDLPHEVASYAFGFTTGPAPAHLVTVQVTGRDAKDSLSRAHVLLRPASGYPYRAHTDEAGVAKIAVPEGEYELYVSKDEYHGFRTAVKVADDITIKAELVPSPPVLY